MIVRGALGGKARLDRRHGAGDLVGGDDAARQEPLADRRHPALVIDHRVVGVGRERFDLAPRLVDAAQAALGQEHRQRIDPLLPEREHVLAALDRAGGRPPMS